VQQRLRWSRRGGQRKGAGRKRRALRRQVPHTKRCSLSGRNPLHITLRVLDEVGRLRTGRAFSVMRRVMLSIAVRQDFRVVHASIQGNHLHLICEANDRRAVTRGVSAFKIAFARRLNAALGRSGRVFSDRYHEEELTTPTQVRHCISYVLNNWRKHGEARGADVRLDPYSTACHFPGWKERASFGRRFVPDEQILPKREPRTWLLREGWQRVRPISVYETPSTRA
jgi:putative transposase